jgi:hypothetical protein
MEIHLADVNTQKQCSLVYVFIWTNVKCQNEDRIKRKRRTMIIKYRTFCNNSNIKCPAGVTGWVYTGGGKIGVFEVNSLQCRKCEYFKDHTNNPRSGSVECSHPELKEKV